MIIKSIKVFIAIAVATLLFAGLALAQPGLATGKDNGKGKRNSVKLGVAKSSNAKGTVTAKSGKRKAKKVRYTISGVATVYAAQDSAATIRPTGNVHLRLFVMKNGKRKCVRAANAKANKTFRFKNIKPGTYTLIATAKRGGTKYSSQPMTVYVTAKDEKNLSVELRPLK